MRRKSGYPTSQPGKSLSRRHAPLWKRVTARWLMRSSRPDNSLSNWRSEGQRHPNESLSAACEAILNDLSLSESEPVVR
jgi:hypothetical protein